MMKKRIALLLVFLLALCLSLSVLADGSSVRFENEAEKFVFVPADTDLFTNFKGLMPGDVVTQQIVVSNNYVEKVDIYLKAEGASEKDQALLSQLGLKVMQGTTVLFDSTADKTDGLTAYKLLGSFQKGASTTLDVTLTVPHTLDNSYMDGTGDVIWTFKAEIQDVKTGDNSVLLTYGLIGGALLIVLMVSTTLLVKRRREDR